MSVNILQAARNLSHYTPCFPLSKVADLGVALGDHGRFGTNKVFESHVAQFHVDEVV